MAWIKLALCLSFFSAICGEDEENEDKALDFGRQKSMKEALAVLKMLNMKEDYDKFSFPECGNTTTVYVDLFPVAIGDISLKLMVFEVQLYITLDWTDCRLTAHEKILDTHSKEVSDNLWFPPTKFLNCMHCKPIKFDINIDVLLIYDTGFYVEMLRTEKLYCKYNLRAYPLEVQRCYAKVISDVPLPFVDFDVESPATAKLSSDISPQEFKVETISISRCPNVMLFSEEYACVALYFDLRREVKFHLIVTYIPSVFLVMLSWISFWLDPTAAAPRVAIGVTTMLALVTQFISTQKDLPSVAYVKAIDVWMFGCIASVFTSLLEFAIANFLNRAKGSNAVISKPILIRYCRIGPVKTDTSSLKQKPQKSSKPINHLTDKISRILFPVVFIIFQISYWNYYLKNNRPIMME